MSYGNYFMPGWQQPNYYPMSGAVPDRLMQLREGQGPMQPQASNTGIIWVLGEAEAKSYPVAPGNTVILWDKDNPTIFVKSADAAGIPSLRVLDWKERSPQTTSESMQNASSDYVRREEFEALRAKIEALTSIKKEDIANA
jgi:hypothetical protein